MDHLQAKYWQNWWWQPRAW